MAGFTRNASKIQKMAINRKQWKEEQRDIKTLVALGMNISSWIITVDKRKDRRMVKAELRRVMLSLGET